MDILECVESPYYMGPDEARSFTVDFGNLSVTTAASQACACFDETLNDSDVSLTVLSGSATVAGDTVTTKVVSALTAGHVYRLEVYCAEGSNKYERYIRIICPRRPE